MPEPRIIEDIHLRERVQVFRDRVHAGKILASLLAEYRGSDALILAIPAGGVPVAAAMAEALGLAWDVAVVSKITPSWNSEVGYGAVAFDGTVAINEPMAERLGIDSAEREAGTARTREKVARRVQEFDAALSKEALVGRTLIVVDDGLASGFTMRVAIGSLRAWGPREILVAVPTAHSQSAALIAGEADALYCTNIRSGASFAVAHAYERWADVSEDEVLALLQAR